MSSGLSLQTPLRRAPGIGDKTAKALADALDLHTVGDLLHHFPRRYARHGEHTDLASLVEGEDVTVMAQVQSVSRRPMRQRRGTMLSVVVGDGRRALTLTFFNATWQGKGLEPGRWGLFAGRVTRFRETWQLNHPHYQVLPGDDAASEVEEFAGALIPVYPATSAVTTWQLANCIKTVLQVFPAPPDPLPDVLKDTRGLVDLGAALHDIHRPPSEGALDAARQRLTWDEAFALQVTLAQRRHAAAASPSRARPPRDSGVLASFDAALPFTLTAGQRDVGETLAAELAVSSPMHRLLQGEVGSGKTVCALRAMLQVVDAGGQAALLAPTEVLAAQHARSLRAMLGPLGEAGELGAAEEATRIALLTGSMSAAARRRTLAEAASGEAGIVVGTHALIQEGVEFADLGLVVVDEQHRFGVEQRDALRAKGRQPPHVLVMTATPIPRTVAMTVFGDLETSELAELPAGRSPIASHVVPVSDKPHFLDRAWTRIREEVGKGHQAYVVCPRIGDDGTPDPAEEPGDGDGDEGAADSGADRRAPLAVADLAPLLAGGPLAGLRLGVLHGRLPADEKDAVMRDFTAGRIDVLVATTVIEVGVDVPNATAMVIMDADRFGVSQLHQLRGRVGRGSAPGLCLLVTEAFGGTPARQRLDAVAATSDGFELARLDLEQRREGDVLGAAQSGRRSRLRLLSLLRDVELIETAREEASRLVAADPDLRDHPALAATVAAMVDAERAEYLEKG
ncbi:MAG: ATP-dependent helicase RecG [Actinomycetota bacterium]|jgi:ATP-dependent DNA helicase RecG|nr:ATP-dependent helicase RecG [Cryptosporangiaceae bacterium]MDQ1678817.1 ATP-dependent helicase RecG [Actinomycetota bacterium]